MKNKPEHNLDNKNKSAYWVRSTVLANHQILFVTAPGRFNVLVDRYFYLKRVGFLRKSKRRTPPGCKLLTVALDCFFPVAFPFHEHFNCSRPDDVAPCFHFFKFTTNKTQLHPTTANTYSFLFKN